MPGRAKERVSTTTTRQHRLVRRPWLAVALATVLVAPGALAPAGAAAHGVVPAAITAHGLEDSGPSQEPEEPTGPAEEALSSIHYRHAEEHADDVIAFEPGEAVRVPFTPRSDDDWDVDGRAPRALPTGSATGQEMQAAEQGSVWSAGVPEDVAAPAHFAGDASVAPPGSRTASPTSIIDQATDEAVEAAPVGPSGLRREIFGFLPYWEVADSSTVLDWRTLSTLAYFSVGCTSSGSLMKRNLDGSNTTGWAGWTSSKMTSIINAAHQHHSRVVLTVSCFAWSTAGANTQAALLGSGAARSSLARQIAAAVRDRGADGANLDFEPIVAGYSDEFVKLVRSVRAELNAVAPGYQLTFDTMGSIGNQPIAEATAPGGADAVFVMGYDYRTASASVAGSISPLTGPVYDLTDTVKAYTAKIAPSKVILGVPYYGRAWSTPSNAPHARNISGTEYGGVAEPVYAQAVDLVAAYGRRYDAVEQSPWTAYRKETCTAKYGCVTSWRELYYDDAASLKLRYDLVNRSNLRGAGIWALGYDGARPELRSALADKFIADKTAPVTGVVTLAAEQRDEGFRVAWTSFDESPITGYDVQASVDGGPFSAWLTGTAQTSSTFLGTNGRTYAFRVRARDVHGNVSPWRSIPLDGIGTPGSISVGGFATITTDGLRMRTAPTKTAAIMTTLAEGDALQVIAGPVGADGYSWYQVAGPVEQWTPVDSMQVGGWVAASGNGVVNAVARRPVFATRIDAGITSLKLADGGARVLTPNGDGVADTLSLDWTNRRALDRLTLRVHRVDGSLAGTVALGAGKLDAGPQAYRWDGRLDGTLVPPGAYVIQLQGVAGATSYSAPSASPVNGAQISRFGVTVGATAPTSVVSFRSNPVSPTRAGTVTYQLQFGGAVKWLSVGDIGRSGTAQGCRIGTPTPSGATWTIVVSGCSEGTLGLSVKAKTVVDAVSNWGPATQVKAPTLVIDRTAPASGAPKATLRTGPSLASVTAGTGILTNLAWTGSDTGGAGISSYDVALSRDGGPFRLVAAGLAASSLAVGLPSGHSYRYEVRARDRAGNRGPWVAGATLRPLLVQETNLGLTYRGAWQLGESSHYSGLGERFATTAGASVKLSFVGRGIAFVTTRGPDRGAVKVYLDGEYIGTADTRSPTMIFRAVAFSRTWAVSGFHTLKLVVVGTPGRPRVDLDALEILR